MNRNILYLNARALDWAVAEALDLKPRMLKGTPMCEDGRDGDIELLRNYSTNWLHGGPLLERHVKSVEHSAEGVWQASYTTRFGRYNVWGNTCLDAVCRMIAIRKTGGFVFISDEVLEVLK